MNKFLDLFGKSLGPQGNAEDELTNVAALQKRCYFHFAEQLGARALLRTRYRELDPQTAGRYPQGTMPTISKLLPELPYWYDVVYVARPSNPALGNILAGGKISLPVDQFKLRREEHLASAQDEVERPFCGLFVIPKRRFFLAVYRLEDLPPVSQHLRYPSEIAVTSKDGTYIFTSSAAMLQHIKRELKL